ncbi:hypothetical protein Bpfe_003849 [Biomphalaria pfeifferi]|uniref:Uncharacterized protein n=1 Tax=Biomphalaria pfeifferi TaxID=112525 RepID=A0AAD8C4N9_BIOPF|nr:hypothetical protein Bpfe_003849 [Biomphalaria pfeifferi]
MAPTAPSWYTDIMQTWARRLPCWMTPKTHMASDRIGFESTCKEVTENRSPGIKLIKRDQQACEHPSPYLASHTRQQARNARRPDGSLRLYVSNNKKKTNLVQRTNVKVVQEHY